MPASVTLFLCGDVMTGRGIDQILPHPSDPVLHERYMQSAVGYVELAESVAGGAVRPVDFAYVWGDALAELSARCVDARIINLETSVTRSETYWQKGIHYRMHPANAPVLTAAGIDCCVLANNHVLDWGHEGLAETLATLERLGLRRAGAGVDSASAGTPAVVPVGNHHRVLVFAAATDDSGVPPEWEAGRARPGVERLPDLSDATLARIAERIRAHRRPGDLVVFSLHWGPNWGFEITPAQRRFAHGLIDQAAVDLVHGHSSHHVKAIEVYRERLILYGCGDFLNDYEGISGHEHYRGELGFMYFATIEADGGRLQGLELVPTRIRRLRVNRASADDTAWLRKTLNTQGRPFGVRVADGPGGTLVLRYE